jgi:hypothetical protein
MCHAGLRERCNDFNDRPAVPNPQAGLTGDFCRPQNSRRARCADGREARPKRIGARGALGDDTAGPRGEFNGRLPAG